MQVSPVWTRAVLACLAVTFHSGTIMHFYGLDNHEAVDVPWYIADASARPHLLLWIGVVYSRRLLYDCTEECTQTMRFITLCNCVHSILPSTYYGSLSDTPYRLRLFHCLFPDRLCMPFCLRGQVMNAVMFVCMCVYVCLSYYVYMHEAPAGWGGLIFKLWPADKAVANFADSAQQCGPWQSM